MFDDNHEEESDWDEAVEWHMQQLAKKEMEEF